MRKLSILLVGLTLVAGALAAVLLLDSDDRAAGAVEVAADPAESDPLPDSEARVPEPEPTEATDEPAEDRREEVEQSAEEEVDEPPPLPSWEPAESRWVDVTVILPEGSPPDASLVVLALDEARTYDQLYGRFGIVPERAEEGRDTGYMGLVNVASVDATGAARVAFPPDVETPHVAVSGRYLYSLGSAPVDLEAGRAEIRAELGAWMTGRLLPPPGVEGEWEPVTVRLGTDVSKAVSLGTSSGARLDRRREFEVGGEYEFLAVPLSTTFTVGAGSDELPLYFEEGLSAQPGDHFVYDIQFQEGASIRGRVVDATGDPLAEVEIEAKTRDFYGTPIFDVREAETDEEGRFELPAVHPGKIWLTVEHDGYLDYKSPTPLELADRATVDHPDIELSDGARIAGVVMFPDGTPAVGAEVELDADLSKNTSGLPVNPLHFSGAGDDASTDEDGEFSFSGLGIGPYRLQAEVVVDEAGPRASGTWRGEIIGLEPTEDVEASSQLMMVLDAPMSLAGVVLDLAGEPVTEFEIVAELEPNQWYLPPAATESGQFEDEDGLFELTDLRGGKWTLIALAEGFARPEGLEVELPTDETVEFRLSRPATISGRVLDPDGNPVAGAVVEPELNLKQMIERQQGRLEDLISATSTADGTFSVEGVAPGDGTLLAAKDGWARSDEFAYRVEEGDSIEGVELVLRVGGTITGEVVGEDGEPLVGVDVFIQQPAGMRRRTTQTDRDGAFREEHLDPSTWQVMTMDLTPGDGEGGMEDLMSSLKITVVELEDGGEEHVILGAAPENPVKVRGRITSNGEPVDEAVVSFVPSAGGGFEKMKLDSSDERGMYEVTLVEPGDYLVTVQRQINMGQQNSLEFRRRIPESEDFELDLELPVGRISGTIYGPDGEPLPDSRITLNREGVEFGTMFGGKYTEVATDEAGEYEIQNLGPGAYLVAAGGSMLGGMFGDSPDLGGRTVVRVEVREGQWVRDVDFELEKPGSVSGAVVDHAGQPVKEAVIFARDENGNLLETFSFITTDAGGRFKYTGLSPGQYTIAARKDGLSSSENELIRVESGQKSDVRITMDPGTVLRVSLEDKSGELVPAIVYVTDSQGREMNGMLALQDIMEKYTNGVGSLEQNVGPLPPGTYTVRAVAEDGRSTKKTVTLSGQDERKLRLRLK